MRTRRRGGTRPGADARASRTARAPSLSLAVSNPFCSRVWRSHSRGPPLSPYDLQLGPLRQARNAPRRCLCGLNSARSALPGTALARYLKEDTA